MQTTQFLAILPLALAPAHAGTMVPLPLRGSPPELVASLVVTLIALVLAFIGLRRSVVSDERARALLQQLAAEREARNGADQALAANHEVLCRLSRQHDDVRACERGRIARELQGKVGASLLNLRGKVSCLRVGNDIDAPDGLPIRIGAALADIDAAIAAVRSAAGGVRFGPGNDLRHALERCLAEHSLQHGVRYRFDAGLDPAARCGHDRAARLAVFQVLQEALAASARLQADDVRVRLSEGATRLTLDIETGAGMPQSAASLSEQLLLQVQALGGAVHDGATEGRPAGWSLSLPVRVPAAVA